MEELSALLISPAGTFFTQLTLMLIVFGAVIVTAGRKSPARDPAAARILIGLSLLLLLRVSLSAAALTFSAAGLDPEASIWLERGLTTASWTVIGWLWLTPDRSRAADTAGLLGLIFTIALTILTIGLSTGPQAVAPALWPILSILILLGSISVLFLKRPELWGYGAAMLSILLVGEGAAWAAGAAWTAGAAWANSTPATALGLVRLAQIAAFPILLTLPQRIEIPAPQAPQTPALLRTAPERKRVNLPPGMYGKFLTLAAETDLLQLSRGITETVSYALVADICLIVSRPTSQDEIIIYCGYDQVLEQEIAGAQIAARNLPMISSAIQKHAPLRLPASSASSDLKSLSGALHLPKSGHLLVAPIRSKAETNVGALILLTPYSARNWTQDDQSYLTLAAEKVGTLLDQSQITAQLREELDALRSASPAQMLPADFNAGERSPEHENLVSALEESAYARQALESELQALQENNRQLLEEVSEQKWEQTVEHLQAENIQLQLIVQELETEREELHERAEAYRTAQKESLELLEKLQKETERLQDEITGLTRARGSSPNGSTGRPEAAHLENELKEALREIAHLRNLNGESEIRILELQNLAAANEDTSRQWEMIISLAEEMRQPMSSILGYSDFLLTESVGLLGTLQRKFLERVKNSTSRMSAMVENLIHIAAAESGRLKLNISEVDLASVIDAAIAASSVQMREKTITLLVNIPDNLPTIEGDREAIRLTLIHLLHNAAAATPAQGDITIEIILDQDAEENAYVQIFVSDSGGGIAPEELPGVFDRRLKSRDQLIPGLGVTSSGLSIAKTLVEAHGGRIWVENRIEAGATFCILLPLRQEIPVSLFSDRST